MTKQKQVFVYGTLREGMGNYERILKGKSYPSQLATLKGYTMYSLGGFPAIVPSDNKEEIIVGEVMTLHEDAYNITMHYLDQLEGYNSNRENSSMYLRRIMTVTTNEGEEVEAYVYIWNPNRGLPQSKVNSGDWKEYLQSRYLTL